MIKSMTAFGRGRCPHAAGFWLVEIKCVNGKFLDYQLRLPPSLNPLEERIKKHIAQYLSRGRVNVSINLNGAPAVAARLLLNLEMLREYQKILAELKIHLGPEYENPSLSAFMNNRDLVLAEEESVDMDALWQELRPALDQALNEVDSMRQAEGNNLSADICARLQRLEDMAAQMEIISPRIVENYKERLHERIAKLLDEAAPSLERLAMEVALMADRADISEELVRLRSHIQQFRKFMNSGEAVGRKLDFMVQEINREANTMGAKSPDAEALNLVVEIKAETEKIREQIQNIE
jgi:uncharacterized protein (TIGR00255 family)